MLNLCNMQTALMCHMMVKPFVSTPEPLLQIIITRLRMNHSINPHHTMGITTLSHSSQITALAIHGVKLQAQPRVTTAVVHLCRVVLHEKPAHLVQICQVFTTDT